MYRIIYLLNLPEFYLFEAPTFHGGDRPTLPHTMVNTEKAIANFFKIQVNQANAWL